MSIYYVLKMRSELEFLFSCYLFHTMPTYKRCTLNFLPLHLTRNAKSFFALVLLEKSNISLRWSFQPPLVILFKVRCFKLHLWALWISSCYGFCSSGFYVPKTIEDVSYAFSDIVQVMIDEREVV